MRAHARCVTFAILLLACAGCERRRLEKQADVLEQERTSLAQRAEQRRNSLRDSTDRLAALNSELTAYNTAMSSYISAHRIAAECIRASRSTWGENNAFSHEVSATTRFGTVLCSVALLNTKFSEEVSRVADKLGEADAHVRTLKDQIAVAERAVSSDRGEVERSETAVKEVAAEIADVQRQMEK